VLTTKGYSGVGIYTRQSACLPIRAEEGILGVLCPPNSSTTYRDLPHESSIGGYPTYSQLAELGVDPDAIDAEGRCVVLEFPAFVLFGVYSPANSNGLRDDFRFAFWSALDARIRNLDKMGKRVVLTGDLNVSRDELDTAGGEEDRRKMGLTHEQYVSTPNRRIFNQLLDGGEVVGERDEGRERPVLWDICRAFHEGRKGMYTHWEQKINARPGNYGSRIDFVLCSISMKDWMSESNIQEGLMVSSLVAHVLILCLLASQGSDHCPVYAVCKELVHIDGNNQSIYDIMNPPGIFHNGKRLKQNTQKDIPAFSAKLLPEFDKRRNIRDMFKRQASSSITQELSPVDAFGNASPVHTDQGLGETKLESTREMVIQRTPSISTSTPPSPLKPASSTKRKSQASPRADVSKRNKASSSSATTTAGQRGQQSLKGFFLPKQPQQDIERPSFPTTSTIDSKIAQTVSNSNSDVVGEEQDAGTLSLSSSDHNTVDGIQGPSPALNLAAAEEKAESDSAQQSETVFDPIVSKESWTKLFKKREAPRCEDHNEPCISFETKKKGFNCGRSFWMCPR
jgi:AP endonuclease-2